MLAVAPLTAPPFAGPASPQDAVRPGQTQRNLCSAVPVPCSHSLKGPLKAFFQVDSYHDFAQPSLNFVDDDDGGPVAPDLRVWRVIVQNARDFAERHGIKLYQMD